MRYQYKREPLTDEEANHLANACESFQEKLIIWTLLDTGLRVSEFTSLRKENIDWQNHRLTIYGKGGIYGKKTKRRVVPTPPRVQALLERQFTFEDEIKMCNRTVQRIVKKVANKAGIPRPVTPHVLRHTFAVTCIRKDFTTRSIQEILGHDHLSTTEIYLNLSPEDVIREYQKKW